MRVSTLVKMRTSIHKNLKANERGLVSRKPRGLGIDVALAYPNTYYIGMSNLGFQSVYQLFNSYHWVTCERVFAPDQNVEHELLRARSPLRSLESDTPVSDFDVLAFSVSFE